MVDMQDPPTDPPLQHSASNLTDGLWDVSIVGAGPAGATVARSLALHGHRVLLLDRSAFPREKVCGDGLSFDSVQSLRRTGMFAKVAAAGHEVPTALAFSPGGHSIDIPGPYYTLCRSRLDEILAEAAVDAGATFAQAEVTDIDTGDSGRCSLTVRGTDTPIRAGVAIVATGVDIGLVHRLGILNRTAPSAVALRRYVRSPVKLDHLIGSYDASIAPGYGWVFPMGDDTYNIGCIVFYKGGRAPSGTNIRRLYDAFVREFDLASEIVGSAIDATPLRGAKMRCGMTGTDFVTVGNAIVIGEAMGTTFPFTGEGIGKAMESAELAGEAVHESLSTGDYSALRSYPERLKREFAPRYEGYQIAENWLGVPWLNDFVARRASRSPYLRDAVVGIVEERLDPRKVFSLRGLLRSFWR